MKDKPDQTVYIGLDRPPRGGREATNRKDRTMSETKHSAAPWRAEKRERCDGFAIMSGSYCIATTDSNEANARLIAAAPAMYAALKVLQKTNALACLVHDLDPMAWRQVESAIIEAEGGAS